MTEKAQAKCPTLGPVVIGRHDVWEIHILGPFQALLVSSGRQDLLGYYRSTLLVASQSNYPQLLDNNNKQLTKLHNLSIDVIKVVTPYCA